MARIGDEEGRVHLWRVDTGRFTDQSDADAGADDESEAAELAPDLSWKAHGDAVGSVSFHPYEPWLLSVSGSRRWDAAAHTDDSSVSGGSSDEETNDSHSEPKRAWTTLDSSLKVWDFSLPP